MVTTVMSISEDLKNFINSTQQKLKRDIFQHHAIFRKLQLDPKNSELEKKLKHIQQSIKRTGDDQQFAIHRIKLEVREYGKKLHTNGLTRAAVDKTTNLNNAIQVAASKIKKPSSSNTSPALPVPSSTTASDAPLETITILEESSDTPSSRSPEPPSNPTELDDFTQSQFLKYFGLVTHTVHDEMQKKRVERKRRSTANPQFFYGTRWDFPKRKRNAYLMSNVSPPHTRQAAKNKAKAERPTTPPSKDSSPDTTVPVETKLTIPKLPVGLTIEPVVVNCNTPDAKLCVVCFLPGGCLSVCVSCMNGFHVSCHNRPLVQQPKKCPKCIVDVEVRAIGSLNVPSCTTVSCIPTVELTEKLREKQKLLEENKSLTDELIKLQDQHSQLTISLKEQQLAREELLVNHHTTEDKIKNLLCFINSIKSPIAASLQ